MKLAQKSDAEILAIASPIMDNLMDASTATMPATLRILRIG